MGVTTYIGELMVSNCPTCGCTHACPASLRECLANGSISQLYCPVGHIYVIRENEATVMKRERDRLAAQLANERERAEHYKDERDKTANQLRATKGVVTRTKNRISNGVCPCCNRTFQDLLRHMTIKHPHYKKSAARKE